MFPEVHNLFRVYPLSILWVGGEEGGASTIWGSVICILYDAPQLTGFSHITPLKKGFGMTSPPRKISYSSYFSTFVISECRSRFPPCFLFYFFERPLLKGKFFGVPTQIPPLPPFPIKTNGPLSPICVLQDNVKESRKKILC